MTDTPRTAAEIATDKARLAEEEAALRAPIISDLSKALRTKAFADVRETVSRASETLPDGIEKSQAQAWLSITANLITSINRAEG